ncbi:hypothetical protein F511_14261 [Dorcoceras hygrometricum]|uniref:TIR domain-containing protein n=1 Tax=Dorcoceras hygrometricum TaxID=472368 RepID=A0A2Z7BNP7_9LAMI|nr:hypothetical protein F511_14261 [Dorcoceras hygrometricum]
MDERSGLPAEGFEEIPTVETKSLTIKIKSAGKKDGKEILANVVPSYQDSALKNSSTNSITSSSPCNSPLISPPSSAFVSALQSPYISPRAILATQECPTPATTITHPSPPMSFSGSQSDDIPSTSYTPPPERQDYTTDPGKSKLKIVTCVPETAPRISFSFAVPRNSFTKGSVSPVSNAKLRNCDVYIGFHGQNPNLTRFCKWLKSELEVQGIASFVADRANYVDNQSCEIADKVICSVTFGLVVITSNSLVNRMSLEEIRFFAQKKNLIPLFFDTDANEIRTLFESVSDIEFKEALDLLKRFHEFQLEAKEGKWRSCVSKAVHILRGKLGRRSVVEKEFEGFEEMPFLRNEFFVGRETEIMEIETALFGCRDYLADEESEVDHGISSVGKREPAMGRNSFKRPKQKKSKSGKFKNFGSSVVCINGLPGIGKTELALEFAYRYSQRYKMVLWVGGEARYFRQNILNLSLSMGLDVSADEEKERGRIRSFDEQESEAFKRVKRELFRDTPYLLVIDNLENAREWWEGKDLHDFIPRNTGGTHVIITTRPSTETTFDSIKLQPLPLCDAMAIVRRRGINKYPAEELEFLEKFDEKLGSSSFGLSLVASLISEFAINPSALYEAVSQSQYIHQDDEYAGLSIADAEFCKINPFLMKTLSFCGAFLQQKSGNRHLLASKMLKVGAWLAPAPVSANLLAAAASNIPSTREKVRKWTKCLKLTTLNCYSGCFASQTYKKEEDSALLLVKLGLARKTNRQPGCWIQFHPITQTFARRKDSTYAAKAMVHGVRKTGNTSTHFEHLWASTFLVFGFRSEGPVVQLKAIDMVLFIKKTALPLAIRSFTTFSRCNSALELLKVCTTVLEEVEKSFVSQIQDWCHGSLCWKNALNSNQKVDEYVWQEVTLLKAKLLETRARLLLRGGHFSSGEEVCRTCVSIRTVVLGHRHPQTLAAQETLAKLVRMRSKT